MLAGLGEILGRRLGLVCRARHLHREAVDVRHQPAHLVDGKVDGIGDGAGEALRHRCMHGEVPFCIVRQLVQ